MAKVIEQCRKEDLVIFLEIPTYSIEPNMLRGSAAFARTLPHVMECNAERMGALKPDVLKLEFPANPAHDPDPTHWAHACEAVSAATGIPWIVLSAGADFDLFCQQTEVACKTGASGFIAGRSVWQEGASMPSMQRECWLADVAAERMKTLSEIALRYARPWTDFYPAPTAGDLEGRYQRYE